MNWKTILFSAVCLSVNCHAGNLFPPGDFEEWETYTGNNASRMQMDGNLAPKNWKCSGSTAKLSRDTDNRYSGNASVKITISPKEWSELLYLPFPVKPGRKYLISFRLKGENVSYTGSRQSAWGGVQASPSLEKPWIDKKGELIFTRKTGTFGWTEFKKSFVTRPADKGALIRFNIPPGSGTLWLDDFRIEEAGETPAAAGTNTRKTETKIPAEYSFRTSLNKDGAIYRAGEPIVYTVQLLEKGIPAEGKEFQLEVFRGTERIRQEKIKSSAKAHTVSIIQETPGQILFKAGIADPNAKQQMQFLTGAMIDPVNLKTNIREPDDFDRFWNRQKELLKSQKMELTKRKVPSGKQGFVCYDVKISCPGINPVRGYLTMPADAKEKQYPVRLNLHGAGNKSSYKRPLANQIVFDFNVHGILNGQPDSYYRNLFDTNLKDYQHQGRGDREKCYFRGIYLRLLRALEFVKTLPEWNGKDLIVYGYSMGGAQALAAAGMDHEVSLCVANDPALADHGGLLDRPPRQPGWPGLIDPANPDTIRTAGYFDSIFFARRIQCETYLASGLTDLACPSTGIRLVYNNLNGKKNIIHSQKGHCGTRNTAGEKRIEEIVRNAANQFKQKK